MMLCDENGDSRKEKMILKLAFTVNIQMLFSFCVKRI